MVKQDTYLEGFLLKRIKKLLPSFIIITALCVIAEYLLNIKILEIGGKKLVVF